MDGWQPHVASAAMSAIPRVERTTIYLDAEQRRRLRSLAASSDRPRDQLIREAIDRYLGRRDVFRLPSWVGAWTGGLSGGPRTIQHQP
jgi:Ribbon-helix-helix protein, copG family